MDGCSLICDQMLVKLARWLRMAGYDTLTPISLDDEGIFQLARETQRVLVTRDKDLASRKGIRSLRIISDTLDEQLEELLTACPRPDGLMARCPLCNGTLDAHTMDQSSNGIPCKVRSVHEVFYRCSSCQKEYWSGTHWDRIVVRLSRLGVPPDLPALPQVKSNSG